MILSSISTGRLTPLGQMRACSNLFHLLRAAAREEAVLRRNRVKLPRDICLDVLTELELVANLLDRDLRRELMAAHDRFAETTTTLNGGRIPNPQMGANLQFAMSLVGQVIEALAMTLMVRHPDQLAMGKRIIADMHD